MMDKHGSGEPGEAPAGDGGAGDQRPTSTPEEMLQDLGAQIENTSLLPVSLRESWFFVYDELLSQSAASRFTKGMHAGKIVSLPNYTLAWPYFHLPFQTALPSLQRTNRGEDVVWGWLYDARGVDFALLDRQRRIPKRYRRIQVRVRDRGGRRFPAFTYVLNQSDDTPGKPSVEYRDRLVTAATERNLPAEWLTQLRSIETKD